jgi:death-on-curing protein
MDAFRFVDWEEMLVLHEDELKHYGGQAGFIDENVVRSAMARPQFASQYDDEADVADLAAEYMYGLATTQGFADGNKRTATVVAIRFVRKNGWNLKLTSQLLYWVAMAVARNEMGREELAEILRDHMEELEEK